MQFAYGVLEQQYEEDLSMDEGRTVAARAVESAVERDTASGNGLYVAEITPENVDIEGYESFDDLI
jgi:proteasome beta subunit